MLRNKDSVELFRHSAPYINAHRHQTFVLMFGGEAFADKNFANIIHDIALLSSLGVKLVLVHGARPQIDQRVTMRDTECRFENDVRITDSNTLEAVKDAAGSVRAQIEALLSMGLANSPMHGAKIRVCGGNHVIAQPMGVRNGVDYEHTGMVRRIDKEAIEDHLNDGSIVLLSPIGYSPTGEVFNLSHEEVATRAAIALGANKLIAFSQYSGLTREDGTLIRTIEHPDFEAKCGNRDVNLERTVSFALANSVANGIERAHCISYKQDGALLQELFTRDGAGTLVVEHHYEQLRQATIDDVGGILNLIAPAEESGILVTRSRERLEQEISQFTVIVRDGTIISCAALYAFQESKWAELACVVIHPEYRGKQRGERLLAAIVEQARSQKLDYLFVLTTVTAHWFIEQGFNPVSLSQLPQEKQQLYNLQRNSKAFALEL